MNCPHPQPFSRRRRELKVLFPLLWERARVREVQGLNTKTHFYLATPTFVLIFNSTVSKTF
jgi:hypothetical protein